MAGSTSAGRFVVPKTITGRDRSTRTASGTTWGGTEQGGARWGTGDCRSEGDAGRGETWRGVSHAPRGQAIHIIL